MLPKTLLLASLAAVSAEGSGRSELPKLVPNHVFCYENLDVGLAIVHLERRPYKLGDDRATTRPSPDRLVAIDRPCLLQLSKKLRIYVWPLFCRTSHLLLALDRYLNFN